MDAWDGRADKEEPALFDIGGSIGMSRQKSRSTLRSTGIGFQEAMDAVCNAIKVAPAQTVAGEKRQAIQGWSGGRKLLVIVMIREGVVRIISARRAR